MGRTPDLYSLDGKHQTLREWSEESGVPVERIRHRLAAGHSLRESLSADRMPMPPKEKLWDGEQLKRLVEMRNRGCTLLEMGKEFGVTRERIRQVLNANAMKTLPGKRNVGCIALSAAARRIGASLRTAKELLRDGDPVLVAGNRTRVPETLVPELRSRLEDNRTVECLGCGSPMDAGKTGKRYCSPECLDHRNRCPPKEAISEWNKELQEKLKGRDGRCDKWVTLSNVCGLGLSQMQILWLGMKEILTTRPHPTEKWRGRPVNQYSMQEVKIAASIFKKHKPQQASRV